MKIECTVDEANEFIESFHKLQSSLEVTRKERNKTEETILQLNHEISNLRQKVILDTSLIEQIVIKMVHYYNEPNYDSAQQVRNALNDLFPNKKILQIKFIRAVSGASLQDAKDFLDSFPSAKLKFSS